MKSAKATPDAAPAKPPSAKLILAAFCGRVEPRVDTENDATLANLLPHCLGVQGDQWVQRPFLRPSINKGRSTNFFASHCQIEGSKGSITFPAFFVNNDSSFAANTLPRIDRLCFSEAWGIYFFIIPSL